MFLPPVYNLLSALPQDFGFCLIISQKPVCVCGIPPSTFHFVPEFEHYLATWGILGLTVSVFIIISSKKMSVPVKSLPVAEYLY